MPKITYKLSSKIDKKGESQIYLDILSDRKTHYRLKSGVYATQEQFERLERSDRVIALEYLSELEKRLYEALPCDKEKALHILDMVRNSDDLLASFENFTRNRAIEKGLSNGTLELYHSTKAVIEGYLDGRPASVKSIDTSFLNGLIEHMCSKGLSNVTQENYWRVISAYLGHLYKEGQIDHKLCLYKPVFRTGDNDVVYLTHNELYRMMGVNVKGTNRIVRDLFVIQCMTGMRYSDMVNLKKENIREDANGKYISILTRKTAQRLKIYLNSTVCEILETYDWTPPYINMLRVNHRLPKIAKAAGIMGDVETVKFVGSERIVEHRQKWEVIRSHTARRTYVCLCLEAGISAPVIMATTGHRQLASFQKYMSISDKKKSEAATALEI